ncbi:MAG: sulfurtransferase [Planctomycetota bacterium]|nr:MAG: sulfurtransferase [Planctomycetota bacterium]
MSSFRLLLVSVLALAAIDTATATDSLVSTEWLESKLNDPAVHILEVSVNPGVYERGHIPGASNLVWHTDLVDPTRRDIVDGERLQELLRAAGVNKDSTIVLYGDTNNWFAAWGFWILDVYGLGEQTRLLDGGRAKWEAENRPLSPRPRRAAAGNVTIGEDRQSELRARLTDVVAAAEDPSTSALLDIRSPAEYSGRIIAPEGVQELAIRAGHVPGAVNVPWGALVAEDGTFKSADDIRAIYAEHGIDGSTPIIAYCRIGERSSHSWFALRHILGYDARNYDGSWTEYGNAVGVPISNPAGTIWQGK